MLIKSKKALEYSLRFAIQCPIADPMLVGDLAMRLDVYYASRRPDLSAADLIKDLMQGTMYANDRQVKAEQSIWNLAKEKPRVRIRLREINSDGCTEMSSLEPSVIWGTGNG